MDHPEEFSNSEMGKAHLAIGQAKELEQRASELAGGSKALAGLEAHFFPKVDLMKRGVLGET